MLGKKENVWLFTFEWWVGKLILVLDLFLVLGGGTSQAKSSRGSTIDLDCALWRRWSLALVLRDSSRGQLRRPKFLGFTIFHDVVASHEPGCTALDLL